MKQRYTDKLFITNYNDASVPTHKYTISHDRSRIEIIHVSLRFIFCMCV